MQQSLLVSVPEEIMDEAPPKSLRQKMSAYWTMACEMYYSKPISHWILLFLGSMGMLVAFPASSLLSRIYFANGGKSKWIISWVSVAGWPLIAIVLIPSYFFLKVFPTPLDLKLTLSYVVLGFLSAADNLMYAYAYAYLPASTAALLASTSLVFSALFGYLLVKNIINLSIINSIVIITAAMTIIALDSSSDRYGYITDRQYIIGFVWDILGSALHGLIFALSELVFVKLLGKRSFLVVLEQQLMVSLFAFIFTPKLLSFSSPLPYFLPPKSEAFSFVLCFLSPSKLYSIFTSLLSVAMAVAEFTPSSSSIIKKTSLYSSQLSYVSTHQISYKRRFSLRPLQRTHYANICCSVTSNEVQAPVVTNDLKKKPECFGVFCLTYDLKAEEETSCWKKLINVSVSGAAGMIANHLLFKLAAGEVFGPDQPIALKLLGSERSIQALEGVAMELEDSLYPLLREVSIGIDPYEVFQDAEWALLIGAKPRGPGMERADLLDINGQIFAEQGKALNAVASRNVKVIVVGNPCNTNALICLKNAPDIPAKNFHALTRLDENRAKCQLALKAGVFYDKVSNVTIWGNHSTTQVPDYLNAKINGFPVKEVIRDTKWLEEEFTEKVQKRGGVLIQKWGRSSAASTAVSVVDAIRSLVTPTPEGDWFSTGVYTDGNPYGIAEGIVFSMPCRSKGDGDYELVKDVIIDDYLRSRIKKSEDELLAEKRCVAHLTGEGIAVCDLPGDTMLPGEM